MEEWRRILAESIVKPHELAEQLGVDPQEIEAVIGPYPMRITPTVISQIPISSAIAVTPWIGWRIKSTPTIAVITPSTATIPRL